MGTKIKEEIKIGREEEMGFKMGREYGPGAFVPKGLGQHKGSGTVSHPHGPT